jgi:prevent-host-death family protein
MEGEMRSYSVHEARSRFSEVVDRALAGEPQRVTRYGKDTVVVVSETEWLKHGGVASGNLGAALLALGEAGAFADDALVRPDWMQSGRELGGDFS